MTVITRNYIDTREMSNYNLHINLEEKSQKVFLILNKKLCNADIWYLKLS